MTRAQIEIDIPDGVEIVKIVDQSNSHEAGRASGPLFVSLVIDVRKAWQWPSWLECDWVGRNKNETLSLGIGLHEMSNTIHFSRRAYWVIGESFLEINLPPCTDWRQSLRLNPNREVKS